MEDERRKHQRVPLLLDVTWEAGAGRYEARTSDVSMDGCFISAAGQVAVGEIVNFKLCLPGGHWMEFQGEVTNEFPNMGFGVRFINLSDEARTSIEQLNATSAA